MQSRQQKKDCSVALLSTAPVGRPGSMRAYAELLVQAMARHAPEIRMDVIELDPAPPRGAWGRRLRTLSLPLRARKYGSRTPDVWHVLDASRAYLAPSLGAGPVIATVHDIIPRLQDEGRFPGVPRLGWAARHWWRGNAKALAGVTMAICDSASTANDLQEYFAVQPARCRVIPLPLNIAMARLSAEPSLVRREQTRVLHIGNDGFYKNRAGVLRVFARIAATAPDAELTMAGPAPAAHLLALAAELDLAGRIEWLIDPSDAAVADSYRRAAVLLFPSLYEGFGWPALEAMAFGLPVVASNAGALPEVVGAAGECFAPDDEEGMARAVGRLLTDPVAWRRAVDRGLSRAAGFSEMAFANGMRDAYLEAAGRSESGVP